MPLTYPARQSGDMRMEHPIFPRFLDLPSELRTKIWHIYCPDLDSTTTLVLGVNIAPIPGNTQCHAIYDTPRLEEFYEKILAFTLVHHETRDVVGRALPDTLDVRRSADGLPKRIRFMKKRDIVFLEGFAPLIGARGEITPVHYDIRNAAEQVENVAINRYFIHESDHRCLMLLLHLRNLQQVFYCRTAHAKSELRMATQSWKCTLSTLCHREYRRFDVKTSTFYFLKVAGQS